MRKLLTAITGLALALGALVLATPAQADTLNPSASWGAMSAGYDTGASPALRYTGMFKDRVDDGYAVLIQRRSFVTGNAWTSDNFSQNKQATYPEPAKPWSLSSSWDNDTSGLSLVKLNKATGQIYDRHYICTTQDECRATRL